MRRRGGRRGSLCGIDTCVRYSCEGQEEDVKMAASGGA